ncbi:MAG: hypothetical protein ACK5TN_03745 [Acidobacteriota bacterium]|jgi:hypothetical protein
MFALNLLSQLSPLLGATLCFCLFLFIPGWLLGEWSGWLGWRNMDGRQRTTLAMLLSLGISPVLVYSLSRWAGFPAVWALFGLLWAIAFWRLLQLKGRLDFGSWGWDLAILASWAIVYSLSVVDLVFDREVWVNINAMDAVAHVSFVDAITRTGIPPDNPFSYPGQSVPLFYYYFWYLMCSLVDQLGMQWITARAAVQAGSLWIGILLALLAGLYAERIGLQFHMSMPRRRAMVWILVAVTGFDLLPWSFAHALHAALGMGSGGGVSLEHWNEQATAWLGAVIMSPHHVAALIMCMTGILVWIETPRWQGIWIAGLAIASAAGTSLYVTLSTVTGLMIFGGWQLARGKREGRLMLWRLAGVAMVAALFYAPFAFELLRNSTQMAKPLTLTVRAFLITDYWLPSILKPLKQMPVARYVLRLVFLPLNYLLEFGYFLMAAALFWKWRRAQGRVLGSSEQVLLSLLAGSALLCTFIASTLSGNNDLGWRGFLIAQFVLLLWALPVTYSLLSRQITGWWRKGLLAALSIGILGTATEIINFRVRTDGSASMRSRYAREAYQWIFENTSNTGIVAFNPIEPIDFFSALIGNRQVVSAGRAYGSYFGIGKQGEIALMDSLRFFAAKMSATEQLNYFSKYQVSILVVLPGDAIWRDSASLTWLGSPSYENPGARVFVKGYGAWK